MSVLEIVPIRRPETLSIEITHLKEALIWLEQTMYYARENPAAVRNRIRLAEEAMRAVVEEANRP